MLAEAAAYAFDVGHKEAAENNIKSSQSTLQARERGFATEDNSTDHRYRQLLQIETVTACRCEVRTHWSFGLKVPFSWGWFVKMAGCSGFSVNHGHPL